MLSSNIVRQLKALKPVVKNLFSRLVSVFLFFYTPGLEILVRTGQSRWYLSTSRRRVG